MKITNCKSWPMTLSMLLLVCNTCCSQEESSALNLKGFSVSSAFTYGKIWKHTPKFQPTIEDPACGIELSLMKHTSGKKWWQQVHHYPSLGFMISTTYLGNKEILGRAWSL